MTARQKRLAQELIPFLDRLTLRQRDVIDRRYGLVDGTTHTLNDIAADLYVTPNRVREIEAAAFALLRRRWETAQSPKCGYCKDCKWYAPLRFDPEQADCRLIIDAFTAYPEGAPEVKASLHIAISRPDCLNHLRVEPTFGCVQFEKPSTKCLDCERHAVVDEKGHCRECAEARKRLVQKALRGIKR